MTRGMRTYFRTSWGWGPIRMPLGWEAISRAQGSEKLFQDFKGHSSLFFWSQSCFLILTLKQVSHLTTILTLWPNDNLVILGIFLGEATMELLMGIPNTLRSSYNYDHWIVRVPRDCGKSPNASPYRSMPSFLAKVSPSCLLTYASSLTSLVEMGGFCLRSCVWTFNHLISAYLRGIFGWTVTTIAWSKGYSCIAYHLGKWAVCPHLEVRRFSILITHVGMGN